MFLLSLIQIVANLGLTYFKGRISSDYNFQQIHDYYYEVRNQFIIVGDYLEETHNITRTTGTFPHPIFPDVQVIAWHIDFETASTSEIVQYLYDKALRQRDSVQQELTSGDSSNSWYREHIPKALNTRIELIGYICLLAVETNTVNDMLHHCYQLSQDVVRSYQHALDFIYEKQQFNESYQSSSNKSNLTSPILIALLAYIFLIGDI